MLVLAGILLGLGAVIVPLWPLLAHRGAPLTDGSGLLGELRELQALKRVTYETLQDIELDHHAGKIAEGDYRDMTDRYTREAVRLVQRIQAIEAQLGRGAGSPSDAR